MRLYETLNVKMDSTYLEIEKSYKRLMLEVHPTRTKIVTKRYFEINEAYEILKDRYKRDFYNLYGDKSIKILLNNKEGFIISRCFNKSNLVIFLLLIMICLTNLMFLPIYIYFYKDSGNVSYTIYIVPFLIADCLFVLPIYRAYKLINKMNLQVFNMLKMSINFIIFGFEILVTCLYADNIINEYVGCVAISLLEFISMCFSYYSANKVDEFNGNVKENSTNIHSLFTDPFVTIKKYILRFVWSLSIILIFAKSIPIYIKAPASFSGIFFYLLNLELPFPIRAALCAPVLLYATTFCLTVSNVQSCFIFIPHIILSLVLVGLLFVFYNLFPKMRMRYKEITYEELV